MSDAGTIILKLGGSVISHSNKIIDFNYLREFRDMLQDQVVSGKKFVVVTGGGQTCRDFQSHAQTEGNITNTEDLHWIGTAANVLNAEMVRSFLGHDLTEDSVWKYDDKNRIQELSFIKPIVVAGGFEAGKSGDWVALRIAQALGCFKIFDLKNVDGVYTSDPRKFSNAKKFEKLSWQEYMDVIGNPTEHIPGGTMPVDPIAAKEASELGAEYYIIKATDFASIEAAIVGEEFTGTIITDK